MITSSRRISSRRPGFSLLELVVAMALGMVLLSAIWAMFGIFTKRQEIDRSRTETTQLVRGLHQILSRDLGNIVPQASEALATKIESEAPAFSYSVFPLQIPIDLIKPAGTEEDDAATGSLVGTKSQLKILTFNDGTGEEHFATESNSTANQRAHNRRIVVDWPFKTVEYRFESPVAKQAARDISRESEAIEDDVSGNAGMSRRETFTGSHADNSANLVATTGRQGAEDDLDSRDDARMTKGKPLQLAPRVQEQLVSEETVSEISNLVFAYYDGSRWQDEWNSRESGALPTAIRVRFSVRREKRSRSAEIEPKTRPEPPLRHSRSIDVDETEPFDHEFLFAVSPLSQAAPNSARHPSSFDRQQ